MESFLLTPIHNVFSWPISTFLRFSRIGKPILDTGCQSLFTTLASRHTPSPTQLDPRLTALFHHIVACPSDRHALPCPRHHPPCASSPSSSSTVRFLALIIIRCALPLPSSSSRMVPDA